MYINNKYWSMEGGRELGESKFYYKSSRFGGSLYVQNYLFMYKSFYVPKLCVCPKSSEVRFIQTLVLHSYSQLLQLQSKLNQILSIIWITLRTFYFVNKSPRLNKIVLRILLCCTESLEQGIKEPVKFLT